MNAQQQLSAHDNFKLMTTFPKKVFTSEDYDQPLEDLGMIISFSAYKVATLLSFTGNNFPNVPSGASRIICLTRTVNDQIK